MRRFKRFLLDALIVALAAAAVALYVNSADHVKARRAEDQVAAAELDARLHARQARGRPIYDRLAASAASVEGIVCWGDESLTAAPETSLSTQIANRISDALFTPVFAALTERTGLRDFRRALIPVVNMGASNEGMGEILCRAGARPIYLGQDFYLNEDVMARDILLKGEDGEILKFAQQRGPGFGGATIQDVAGDLYVGSESYDAAHPVLAFGRSKRGAARAVPAGTELRVGCQERYRSCRTVLFFGEHPELDSDEMVDCMRDLLARQSGHREQYVVVCTTREGSALDEGLKAAFGDHYIRNDLAPSEMGLSPTIRLSREVYEVLARYGTFDEVKEGIRAAMAELEALEDAA